MSANQPRTTLLRVRPPGERRSLSRSATRALDILELFGDLRRPLRAVEIARALEMSASSTNQLLKTMVDSAHLTFDAATKAYVPSPRLARFAGWLALGYGAERRIGDIMRELELRSGETVTLATPDGLFMLILDRIGPPGDALAPERGLRVSILGSALGAAYLSTLADGEVRRFADRARVREADVSEMLARIREVRADSVAEETSPDGAIESLAAALPQGGHMAPLVLGLAGPADRVRARAAELREVMRQLVHRHRMAAFAERRDPS